MSTTSAISNDFEGVQFVTLWPPLPPWRYTIVFHIYRAPTAQREAAREARGILKDQSQSESNKFDVYWTLHLLNCYMRKSCSSGRLILNLPNLIPASKTTCWSEFLHPFKIHPLMTFSQAELIIWPQYGWRLASLGLREPTYWILIL